MCFFNIVFTQLQNFLHTLLHSLVFLHIDGVFMDAWGWCTGTTQRDGMGREEGGGFRMGNTCIPVADSF